VIRLRILVSMIGCAMLCAAASPGQDRAVFAQEVAREASGAGVSTPAEPQYVFQVWIDKSITVARSPDLGTASLPHIETPQGTPTAKWIRMPDGSEGRAVGILIPSVTTAAGIQNQSGSPHTMEIVVARDTSEIETTLSRLRLLLMLSWLASSLLCAGILSWVVRRGLHPLTDLCRQIERVDEGRLDRRFNIDNSPVELSVVMDELNQMVGRIRRAFDREQAFAADAAHELRTPLAGLQMTLEVALSRPRESDEYRETARECLGITNEMKSVVDALMELAKPASALTSADENEVIALHELFTDCARPFLADAEQRQLTLQTVIDDDVQIERNAHYLRRIVSNLIDNATHYADEGSEMLVTGSHTDGGIELTVENAATGAPADVAEHAFDAFWRADTARSAVGRHAGLGLSLCQRIVDELSGTIEITCVDARFRVTLRVPDTSFLIVN